MTDNRARVAALLFGLFVFHVPSSAAAKTNFGIDVLKKENFRSLQGSSVALITNHTGVDKYGVSTVDLLHRAPNVKLVSIMTPEHGFRGVIKHGEGIDDSRDEKTGLPIYSLYGSNRQPTMEMLEGVNTIVFDIQDIGTRFYTYIATMGLAMEQAAKKKIRFFVLDRPNPIRGDIVEGDILDADIKRLTGFFPIPVRHGLTVGEIAHWMNETQGLNLHLTIIKVEEWNRKNWFEKSRRAFIPPSPNIRTLTSALLYPGVGCFEATNVSVGRGTDTPFEVFGAPWIEAEALTAHMRRFNFPGVLFEETSFRPADELYKGTHCRGVRLIVTDRNLVRPFEIFLAAFLYISETHPEFKPIWEEVRVVTGSNALRDAAGAGASWKDVSNAIQERLDRFWSEIEPFFLYE